MLALNCGLMFMTKEVIRNSAAVSRVLIAGVIVVILVVAVLLATIWRLKEDLLKNLILH